MGKNKLKKFAEMENIPFVFQYPWAVLKEHPFPWRGKWHEFFGNNNPVTIELGCGKGEYTVGLARTFPDRNFIGIDIKGARMWTGAKDALSTGLKNVAFLRTDIEMLTSFFAPGEVEELWITFPDPQMQKARHRLTGTRMMDLYRKVLAPSGIVNLKTDSPFLYNYTTLMAQHNNLAIKASNSDIYNTPGQGEMPPSLTALQTHYEKQWLDRGLTIKYIALTLEGNTTLEEPPGAEDIEKDTYRSYSRGQLQGS